MRKFNITAACSPDVHYMVDLHSRLCDIKGMIDEGQYFVISRARQYGKTTILNALEKFLSSDYIVVSLDFQFLSREDFQDASSFVAAFARELWQIRSCRPYMSNEIQDRLNALRNTQEKRYLLADLFECLSDWCDEAERAVVLMVDEVDSASSNQVFLDFLSQLRGYYIHRDKRPTFQSVILAGVHDIRNLRQKIRPDTEHKHNSPWNIASRFDVDMSFSVKDIAGMLSDYESDCHTGMNISEIAQTLYEYTSGYPVLVSNMCKLMDEEIAGSKRYPTRTDAWTKNGILEAEKRILADRIPLFESMINKLEDDEKLRKLLFSLLFEGRNIPYNPYDASIHLAAVYGFLKNQGGAAAVANRIFETMLCDWFLSQEITESDLSKAGALEKSQFIRSGCLDMELVLRKFVEHFHDLYGDRPEVFLEEDGRRFFLLYLRPIINGAGNYYMEAQTRDQRRTDVIVDYNSEQFILEMKLWHGEEYNARGEKQLLEYLDYYHIQKGYMLSFNFNKNKQIGVKTIRVEGKTIVEAVV